eukprot:403365946
MSTNRSHHSKPSGASQLTQQSSAITPQMYQLLRDENSNLESVNTNLIMKIQQLEDQITDLKEQNMENDQMSSAKDQSLEKAQHIIKKLNTECDKTATQLKLYEEQIALLKTEIKMLKSNTTQTQKQRNEQDSVIKQIERLTEQLKDKDRAYEQSILQSSRVIEAERLRFAELTKEYKQLQQQHNQLNDILTKEENKATQSDNQLLQKLMTKMKLDYEDQLKVKQQEMDLVQNQAKNQIKSIIQQHQSEKEQLPFATSRGQIYNQSNALKDSLASDKMKQNSQLQNFNLSVMYTSLNKPQKSNQVIYQAQKLDKDMSKLNKENRTQSNTRAKSTLKKSKREKLQDLTMFNENSSATGNNERKLRFMSPEPIQVEESPQPDQQNQISPLMIWLKKQLQKSWEREIQLKKFIQNLAVMESPKIDYKIQELQKQHAKVRSEVEMWQMRNEDLETQLLRWQQKCWSVKQINIEQQRMIKALQMERQEYFDQQAKCRKQINNAYSFAKYECNKYAAVISHDNILSQFIDNLRNQYNIKEESKILEHDLSIEVDNYKRELRQLKFDFENVVGELMEVKEKSQYYRDQYEQEIHGIETQVDLIIRKLKIDVPSNSRVQEKLDQIILKVEGIQNQDYLTEIKIQDLQRKLSDFEEKNAIEVQTLKQKIDSQVIQINQQKEQLENLNDKIAQEAYNYSKKLEYENQQLTKEVENLKSLRFQQQYEGNELDDSIERDLVDIVREKDKLQKSIRKGRNSSEKRTQKIVPLRQSIMKTSSMYKRDSSIGFKSPVSNTKKQLTFNSGKKSHQKEDIISSQLQNYEDQISQMRMIEKQKTELVSQGFRVLREQIFDSVITIKQNSLDLRQVQHQCDSLIRQLQRLFQQKQEMTFMNGSLSQSQSVIEDLDQDPFESFFKLSQDFMFLIKDYANDQNSQNQEILKTITLKDQNDKQFKLYQKNRAQQVIGAFKYAAQKACKVESDLQEMLDFQIYLIEEIIQPFNSKPQNQYDLNDSLQDDKNHETQSLNNLIGDFNFSFERVLKIIKQLNLEPTREKADKSFLSNQKSMKSSIGQSQYNTLEPNQETLKFNQSQASGSSLIVVKEELKRIFEKSHKVLTKGVKTQGIIMYFNSSEELQRHSFRVIKNLKENFQKSKGQYVKKMNQDIDQYINQKQSSQDLSNSDVTRNQLNRLRQEILELKQNELFIIRITDELESLREAFDNSDMAILEKVSANSCRDLISSSVAHTIISDQIGSIMREAKSIKEDTSDENSKARKHLSKLVFELIQENSKFRKLMNKMNKLIKII